MTFLKAHLGFWIPDPKPGELWIFDWEEPWPHPGNRPVKILDVKKKWVRYWESDFRPDSRMRLLEFRWCYKKVDA